MLEAWSVSALISLNSLTHSQDLSLGIKFPHGSAQQPDRVVFIKTWSYGDSTVLKFVLLVEGLGREGCFA